MNYSSSLIQSPGEKETGNGISADHSNDRRPGEWTPEDEILDACDHGGNWYTCPQCRERDLEGV